MLICRYFDEDDEANNTPALAYIPAPGSPSHPANKDSDSEEDPLDAFMAGIEQQVNNFFDVLHLAKVMAKYQLCCFSEVFTTLSHTSFCS